ncbi:hypothetical protein BH10CHL1_BH10CHL1_03390 [soil metagenome]
MERESLTASTARFISSVAAEFNLAEVVSVVEMSSSSNCLWQFTTTKRIFVVKELPYNDAEQSFDLRKAANFEATLIGEQRVLGPIPVQNRSGDYVAVLTDSRGKQSPVRLHHWFTGAPPCLDDPATLANAGRTLRAIQTAGAAWSVRPKGSLQRWHPDPSLVLEHFLVSGHFDGVSSTTLRHTVADALALVHAGESMPGDWIYTHCDHKPENCLSQDDVVAVLDWDECNYCHPRLEAVESALRWAGINDPNPENFGAFMTGYNALGTPIETLHAPDFAKWIAGLLEWFCFQARRTLGEWPEVTETERITAAVLARDALATLQSSLTAIPRWTHLF